MSEQPNPIGSNEETETDQLDFSNLITAAKRYRELMSKEVDGFTDDEIAEKEQLIAYFKSIEKTDSLRQKLRDLRIKQFNAKSDKDYTEDDENLLMALQLIFGEEKR